ncbi:MAG: TetR/AcrR family transcriptional regulator [Acidobacteriaceae bacterium]|nr:TetR/AcrR family transcriptional regulator [Acidobacteriaceae bacterium]
MDSYVDEEPRRIPQQERGERRVAQLLEAAGTVIASAGYEAATMSAIAERAGAPIGSLYQFFPNKKALTQALRTEYGKDYEAVLEALEKQAKSLSLQQLAKRLIHVSVQFVEAHPAFLPLYDAPHSTRSPLTLRQRLRDRLAECLVASQIHPPRAKAKRLATIILQLLKGLNQLYAESGPVDRKQVVAEYTVALSAYLAARLQQNGHREQL